MDLNQQKERLKRELARLEQKEKHIKKQAEAKNIKAITAEILKYDIPQYNNFKKLVGLLTYFYHQSEDFKNGIIVCGEEELNERKNKKTPRSFKTKTKADV